MKCALSGLLLCTSEEQIEKSKYLPISNLNISALPLVKTPKGYLLESCLIASNTPS